MIRSLALAALALAGAPARAGADGAVRAEVALGSTERGGASPVPSAVEPLDAAGGESSFPALPSVTALPPVRSPAAAPHSALVPAGEVAVISLWFMGWNRWVGDARWANITPDSIATNLGRRWVLDDDQFWVNQFGHPYQGSASMTAARSSGLGFWGAVPYVFGGSLFWEIAGETEPPALNDQITTTIGGAVLGEVLHRLSTLLVGDGRDPWRSTGSALVAPVSATNRGLLGRARVPLAEPIGWEVSAGPFLARLPWEGSAPSRWESSPLFALRIDHGVAWHPSFRFRDPFDLFQLSASYSGRSDPVATFLLRGMVAGTSHGGPGGWRGASGVFAGYDLDTPGVFRISTTSVGLGTSGGAPLARGLAVEGTGVVSAIALGAAGQVARNADGSGRDYRFGPGAQAAVDVRLAGPAASLQLGLREYVVFGSHDAPGTEVIGTGRAAAVFRIGREHGVGIEATFWRRDLISPDGGSEAWLGRGFRIFWVMQGLHEPPVDEASIEPFPG